MRTLRLPHRKIGSLVLVALNDYLDALRAPEPKPAETKSQAITIEDVRARLGLALG